MNKSWVFYILIDSHRRSQAGDSRGELGGVNQFQQNGMDSLRRDEHKRYPKGRIKINRSMCTFRLFTKFNYEVVAEVISNEVFIFCLSTEV